MIKIFNNKRLFIFILTLISLGFVFGDLVYQVDYEFDNLLSSYRSHFWLGFFEYITLLGDKYFILLLGGALSYFIYRYWTKDTFLLKVFWIALLMNLLSGFVAKYLIGRDRPLGAEIYEGYTYAFPSGHSLAAFFLYGFISIFFLKMKDISLKWRYFVSIFSAFIILLVGFSRLYLGVHYLSDVLGGYLFGCFWLNFLMSYFVEIEKEEISSSVKIN